MRKEKKKAETEKERIERPKRENKDIDWVALYNSNKLSASSLHEFSLYSWTPITRTLGNGKRFELVGVQVICIDRIFNSSV